MCFCRLKPSIKARLAYLFLNIGQSMIPKIRNIFQLVSLLIFIIKIYLHKWTGTLHNIYCRLQKINFFTKARKISMVRPINSFWMIVPWKTLLYKLYNLLIYKYTKPCLWKTYYKEVKWSFDNI